jgi:hypothetical protein
MKIFSRASDFSFRKLFRAGSIFVVLIAYGFAQPKVKVETADFAGPRPLEDQTRASVVRDYLQAWKSLDSAFRNNRPDLLDAYFVGVAQEKLAHTISEQRKIGIQTSYRDRSHVLKLLFYSPEGLSVQLDDAVQYDEDVVDSKGAHIVRHITTHYLAVLTPTEVRWKVRIFQAQPKANADVAQLKTKD